MLDHLIFNKLKWFSISDNQETVNTGGRQFYAIPKSFTIKAGTYIDSDFPQINEKTGSLKTVNDTECECFGTDGYNYLIGKSVLVEAGVLPFSPNCLGKVKKADVKNVKWGG